MHVKRSSPKPYLLAAVLTLSAAALTLPTPLTGADGAAPPNTVARQDPTDGRDDPESSRNSANSRRRQQHRHATPSESLRRAQEALNLAGYVAGPANGLTNRRTTAALRKFQADRGLRVTGRADSPTLAALGLTGGAAPPPPSACGANPPQNGTGRQHTVDLGSGVKLEMVEVPPGTFCRGATNGSPDEQPVRRVSIGYSFFMGKYEVTQAQWRAVMRRDNPEVKKGYDLPVGQVSWDDAAAYCRRLSRVTGREYRLPTEAEWEYACRAGTAGDYAGDPEEMGWYESPGGELQRVGQKRPNAYGLYDMHGNVWEWCIDHYHDDYRTAPDDGSAWVGGANSSARVQRGGSAASPVREARSAYREKGAAGSRAYNYGFRVVMVPQAMNASRR